MVYALALSLVRPADVDDVAQDAFLRAFRNLDLLADPGG
jgi:DNA-directed RNA polymerase specialized sigma24 family protein